VSMGLGEKKKEEKVGRTLGVVEALDVAEGRDVLSGDEVDRNTLASETSTATDPVDVVLAGGGEVVVDDEGDLLDLREEERGYLVWCFASCSGEGCERTSIPRTRRSVVICGQGKEGRKEGREGKQGQ
jgi:hypothetical protein